MTIKISTVNINGLYSHYQSITKYINTNVFVLLFCFVLFNFHLQSKLNCKIAAKFQSVLFSIMKFPYSYVKQQSNRTKLAFAMLMIFTILFLREII